MPQPERAQRIQAARRVSEQMSRRGIGVQLGHRVDNRRNGGKIEPSRMSLALDELGALLDQRVAAFRERRVDRAGQRKDFAPLLVGKPRRDLRAALQRGFDHQAAAAHAADDTIAAREVARNRRGAECKFRDQRTLCCELMREIAIACRIDDIYSGTDNCDAACCTGESTAMCGCVDAKREPAYNGDAGGAQRAAKSSAFAIPCASRCGCRRSRVPDGSSSRRPLT